MEFQPAESAALYTFGDTDIAARRLKILNEVFGPPSAALLAEVTDRPPALAYDLGCGPGHTTALVSQVTAAEQTIGLDASATHIARARASASGRVSFAVHDCQELPFPAGPADLIYCRLLLAHVPDPVAAARSWATQLTPGGLLVIDEIEWIETTHPVLRAHLRLVESLIATTGARMVAGPLLAGLELGGPGRSAGPAALRQRIARVTELPVATARAATMFAMNLAVWGEDAVVLGLCDRAELHELAAQLSQLQHSPASGEITWGLHQAGYTPAAEG